MKNVKTFLFTIIGIFLLFSCSASAASTVTTSEIYSLANGDYLENYSDSGFNFKSNVFYKSGQKTTYYKSSSGVTLWSVTVKASFSYIYGKSSTCTSVTGSSASSSVAWKVSSASSKKWEYSNCISNWVSLYQWCFSRIFIPICFSFL